MTVETYRWFEPSPVPATSRKITGRDCGLTAKALEAALRDLRIDLNPSSDVARMVRELLWLAGFGDPAPQPDRAYIADPRRSIRAFPLILEARELAVDLLCVRELPGAAELLRRTIGKQLDRLRTQSAAAQDTLFEISMAARFQRAGCAIALNEPDIIWTRGPFDVFGFACKRPKNEKRPRERVVEGARQIERAKLRGAVLIDVEPLFHKSSDVKCPTISYVAEADEVEAGARRALQEVGLRAGPEIERALRVSGVLKVYFCGLVTGVSRSEVFWRRIRGGCFHDLEDAEALDGILFQEIMS